jgi:hypothetical protein
VLRVYTSLVVYIVRNRIPSAIIELVLREYARLAQKLLADPNRDVPVYRHVNRCPIQPNPCFTRKYLLKPIRRLLAAYI